MGNAEANAAEQKDRKETTSGTNEIRCPQEFALYGEYNNVKIQYVAVVVMAAKTIHDHYILSILNC